jgi:ribonuclease HIII
MFDYDKRISEITQILQRCYKLVVITLMKSYGRLIEYVKNSGKSGTYLRCKTYALRFTARKSGG